VSFTTSPAPEWIASDNYRLGYDPGPSDCLAVWLEREYLRYDENGDWTGKTKWVIVKSISSGDPDYDGGYGR